MFFREEQRRLQVALSSIPLLALGSFKDTSHRPRCIADSCATVLILPFRDDERIRSEWIRGIHESLPPPPKVPHKKESY
jgi:hypothetical protein